MICSDLLKKFKYSWGKEEFKAEKRLWQAMVAEYIGCIVMTLVGCSIYGNINENQLFRCFGFGLVMFVIVNFTLSISGGHINPSISISFVAVGRISLVRCLSYLIAQITGALSGSYILFLLCRDREGNFDINRYGATDLNGLPINKALTVEFFINLVLNLTVYSVTDSGRKELAPMAPFSIGMNIAQAHLAAMKLTGPGMNPARSLATSLMSDRWDLHWIYWVGPISGGIVGGLLYVIIFEKGEVKSIADDEND